MSVAENQIVHFPQPQPGAGPAAIGRGVCAELPVLPPDERAALVRCAGGPAQAQAVARDHPAFAMTEVLSPPVANSARDSARIAFWNANRCRNPGTAAAFLSGLDADIYMLCEMDYGMARSGQHHTARDVARQLGAGYAFAVEFLELGLGNRAEIRDFAGQRNLVGYHGNAIVSPLHIAAPASARLGLPGVWLDGANTERRLGARMAVLATIELAGVPVVLAATHLESHCPPGERAGQMARLLGAIEEYRPGAPVLIGGDFNTRTMSKDAFKAQEGVAANTPERSDRFLAPMAFEPLFEIAQDAGYAWQACNAPGPTQRAETIPGNSLPPAKLDWFFSRGLTCRAAEIRPAADAGGGSLSDHDAIAVEITPDRMP